MVNVAQADAAARGRELVTRGDLQAESAALGSPVWRLITAGIVTPEPRSITFDKEPRVAKKKGILWRVGGGRRVCHGAPATSAPVDHASRTGLGADGASAPAPDEANTRAAARSARVATRRRRDPLVRKLSSIRTASRSGAKMSVDRGRRRSSPAMSRSLERPGPPAPLRLLRALRARCRTTRGGARPSRGASVGRESRRGGWPVSPSRASLPGGSEPEAFSGCRS